MNPTFFKFVLGGGLGFFIVYMIIGFQQKQDTEMSVKSSKFESQAKEFRSQMALETAQFHGVMTKEELGKKALEEHDRLQKELAEEKEKQRKLEEELEAQKKAQDDLKRDLDTRVKEFSEEDMKKL